MTKRFKKLAAVFLTGALSVSMLAGCGGSAGTDSGSSDSGSDAASTDSADSGEAADSGSESGSGGDVSITFFNSKVEVQEQMEEMAAQYSEETGVNLEVFYSSDTVSAHLSTKYASNEPYTISMVDPKDIYSLAEEHAVDLSDEGWVDKTTQAISVGDKVYGFPVCVEARGVIYNADAIKNITGEDFDPTKYATLDSFKELLQQLKDGGMESPVAIMKEDWSLAAHYLAQIVEEQEDPEKFAEDLKAGKADLANNEKFNSLMDTFDVLMENNYAKDAAIAAERDVSEQKLAEGEVAFMFGGNWDWGELSKYNASENMGMMPVPQNTKDGSTEKLVGGGSKYLFIDSSEYTSDEQRQAAKDFLNWLVDNEEGQKFITETCALVSPFSNNTLEIADPLSKSVKSYADSDSLIPNYNYFPDDHITAVGQNIMQKYLAGQMDRAELATQLEKYWTSLK